MQYKGITVGVLREIMPGEKRVAVVPETARELVKNGADVLVEQGAGEGAYFHDEEYVAAGARIASSAEGVYENAQVFLKVKEPLFNEAMGKHEAELIPRGRALISFLHPANDHNHEMVKILAEREITSFTLDSIPRISRAQKMDALTSMSTVAGYKAVLFAADQLARFIPMMPTAFGVIKPAQFLVIGTGVAGLQAVATARRLGAKVKTLDIRPDANEHARSLGAEVIPFDIPAELALGQGGYAQRLPEEWYEKEREVLTPHVQESDVIVLTALIPGEIAPILVNEAMIEKMKKGSVIVDISVDQGGNCSICQAGANRFYEGVLISGIANIPATLPVDSTRMFAQNIMYFLNYLVKEGEINTDIEDDIIKETLVTINGKVVHGGTLLAMQNTNDS